MSCHLCVSVTQVCDIIQMMHRCKWNIQICCPVIDMSTRGHSPGGDISTEGQHIWMLHEQACFICFVIWPTTSIWIIIYWKLSTTKVNINNVEYYFVYIMGSANFGNNQIDDVANNFRQCCTVQHCRNMLHRSYSEECNVRLWPTSCDRITANQRSSS